MVTAISSFHLTVLRASYVDRMQPHTGTIVSLLFVVIGDSDRPEVKAHATVIRNQLREDSKCPMQSLQGFCLALIIASYMDAFL